MGKKGAAKSTETRGNNADLRKARIAFAEEAAAQSREEIEKQENEFHAMNAEGDVVPADDLEASS